MLAWIWGVTLITTILTVGIDLNRNVTAFWVVVIGLVWGLGLWLRDVKSITLFGDIYNFFADLVLAYPRQLGLVVSILLTVPYILMYVWPRINDKWRFTHN